jgi:hypothetical protein
MPRVVCHKSIGRFKEWHDFRNLDDFRFLYTVDDCEKDDVSPPAAIRAGPFTAGLAAAGLRVPAILCRSQHDKTGR